MGNERAPDSAAGPSVETCRASGRRPGEVPADMSTGALAEAVVPRTARADSTSLARDRNGDALPAFGPAAAQHRSSGACAQPGSEPVGAFAAFIMGLVSTLHGLCSALLCGRPRPRTDTVGKPGAASTWARLIVKTRSNSRPHSQCQDLCRHLFGSLTRPTHLICRRTVTRVWRVSEGLLAGSGCRRQGGRQQNLDWVRENRASTGRMGVSRAGIAQTSMPRGLARSRRSQTRKSQ